MVELIEGMALRRPPTMAGRQVRIQDRQPGF
jgi:hypothetical protein